MLDYATTMALGQRQYQDVIDMLGTLGLPTEFTQTGGMNAALDVTLEAGYRLLITDEEGSLSWAREEHQGWTVGLYSPDDHEDHSDCLAYAAGSDGSLQALVMLVEQVLQARR